MIKILDMDGLFDKYISDFVYKNIGKLKPEEIEDNIPILYEKFGDEVLVELDGKTPNTFYAQYSANELLECLKTHITSNVPVSDFLCETIQSNKENEDVLISALDDDNEEFVLYVMNMLDVVKSKKCAKKYLNFITWDYPETIKELATELLCQNADLVKDDIVNQFKECSEQVRGYLTQVLSYTTFGDDRVFDILIAEFAKNQDNIPLYAGYLSKYGDERALPFLLTAIESEKINYFDFEELRFAIESLGGTYDKKRDFTKDKIYKKIKGEKQQLKF
jgi:hypothetical protein